ncbi:MAG: hypothetical protein J6D44_18670, partial [Pseudomonas sp.]|nr:hypothetical protein [Pseudomonas sp.]
MEIKNYFAQDAQGNIMPSANCYLYLPGTTTLATGLVDGNGVPISNPFLASSIGQVTFGAPNGVYDLRIAQGARDTTVEIQCADLLQALNETASFLGAKSSAPTTRNDGSPLQVADRYFNTSDQLEYLYKSTGWVANNLDGQIIATSQGASLVGATLGDGSLGTVQQAIKQAYDMSCQSIKDMVSLPQKLGSSVLVSSYHPLSVGAPYGGGVFVFDGSKIRSSHDGMNIFSPTVPYTWADQGASYLYGVGETNPTAAGCWVRQGSDSNSFNAGAIIGTNITASIRRTVQLMNVCSLLKGTFSYTTDTLTLTSARHIIGAGQEVTILEMEANTTGWGILSKGNYNSVSRLSMKTKSGSTSFTGSHIQVENDGFVTYKQEFRELYLRGVPGKAEGKGIHFYTSSDSGKGITAPIVDNVSGWNLRSVLHFSKSGDGYTDSGTFTRIRPSICAYAVDIESKALGTSTFRDVHGRYDAGFTLGHIVNRGTRITIEDCIMYDYASPYIFVEPEAIGCIIGSMTLISQGSSVQDKGWGTQFVGAPNSVTPESSGGAGYGWLEQHDNCLGFNVERNWNVVRTGTSSAVYTGPVSALGPMMMLTAAGAAGSAAQLDYGTVFACNPYQQTKIYGFFWIPQASNLGRFEVGLFNASGLATISLVADVTVNPNFFFLIKQPGQADVIKDTGEPVGTKRHSFGITRTGNGGLTLHFDCLAKFVDVPYTVEALTQPRYKMTSLTAASASVYLFA